MTVNEKQMNKRPPVLGLYSPFDKDPSNLTIDNSGLRYGGKHRNVKTRRRRHNLSSTLKTGLGTTPKGRGETPRLCRMHGIPSQGFTSSLMQIEKHQRKMTKTRQQSQRPRIRLDEYLEQNLQTVRLHVAQDSDWKEQYQDRQ